MNGNTGFESGAFLNHKTEFAFREVQALCPSHRQNKCCEAHMCGIRMYSMTMSGTCATHVLTKAKPKAVWSRRLRCMQVSLCWWSVNCCVQACKQTQRDTQGTKRAKCAHVGDTNNTPPHAIRESGVIQLPTELAFGKSGKLEKTLENISHSKGFTKPQINSAPAARAALLSARTRFPYRRNFVFKLTSDDTGDRLSRVCIIQASLVALSRSSIRIGHRQSFCEEEFKIIVGFPQLDQIERPQVLSHRANHCLERMEPRPRPPVVKPASYETPEQFPAIRVVQGGTLKHPKKADTAVLHRTKKINEGWITNVHSKRTKTRTVASNSREQRLKLVSRQH